MALYRCGGGSASPTLISKNITENGLYRAQNDDADGYSIVLVNVSGSGNCVINTQAEWDALTLAQKKAQGLTVIRNSASEIGGSWRDMTNVTADIIKEFFNNRREDASLMPQSLNHLIYFQGKWREGEDHDNGTINHENILFNSITTGTEMITNHILSPINNYMTSILHDVLVGDSASIITGNGYRDVTDTAIAVGIPFDSEVEIIAEHFNVSEEEIITTKPYDYILFMVGKWSYNGSSSNGVYSISAGTLIQTGSITLEYSGSDNHMTAIYENVPAGTTITLGNGRSNVSDSVVAIGINAN